MENTQIPEPNQIEKLRNGDARKPYGWIILLVLVVLFMIFIGSRFIKGIGLNPQNFSSGNVPLNLLPMYGGEIKNETQLQADKAFIETATKNMTGKEAAAGIVRGAWEFLNARDYENAMRRLNQAWLLDPENSDIYKGYLSIPYEKGQAELLDYAIKVADQNPGKATLRCFVGAIHNTIFTFSDPRDNKSLVQAESEFKAGLEIDPQNPFCNLNYAYTLSLGGQYDESWKLLTKNFSLENNRFDPDLVLHVYSKVEQIQSEDEYMMVGMAYGWLARHDESFDTFEKATEVHPNSALLQCNAGISAMNKWLADKDNNLSYIAYSQNYFNKSIRMDPTSGMCHYNFAILLANQAKYNEAWQEIKKARKLGWENFNSEFLTGLESVYPEPKN